jgi:hypothetical protein
MREQALRVGPARRSSSGVSFPGARHPTLSKLTTSHAPHDSMSWFYPKREEVPAGPSASPTVAPVQPPGAPAVEHEQEKAELDPAVRAQGIEEVRAAY